QAQRAFARQPIEAVLADRGLDRAVLAAPVREQAIDRDRIDDGAGEDVRADLGALLHHHYADVGRDLLETDGGGEPRRPGADDHDVELHRLARRQLRVAHPTSRPGSSWRFHDGILVLEAVTGRPQGSPYA